MPPRLLLILTENWTMRPVPDVADLVRFAVEAERAGIDGVMVSEHIVLGPSADEAGLPVNPRDYALPGNQDPATPWPSPLVLLSAVAAATSRLRLVAGALISPLRHPLATAKDLATLDRLSGGRLVVQPTVSWHQDEYAALGVPFGQRGEILDEQLEIWAKAWSGRSPVTHRGNHYSFGPIWIEPQPARPGGPVLWFGGSSVHPRLIARLVRYGSGGTWIDRLLELVVLFDMLAVAIGCAVSASRRIFAMARDRRIPARLAVVRPRRARARLRVDLRHPGPAIGEHPARRPVQEHRVSCRSTRGSRSGVRTARSRPCSAAGAGRRPSARRCPCPRDG
jgi:Luciferase-like monooxygenase